MDPQGLSASKTNEPAAKTPAGDGGSAALGGESNTPTRPDWAPADHWNEEAGSLNLETFGQHYTEIAERDRAAQERAAALPQKPEDVKFELPQGFNLPEGVQLDEANPMLAQARQIVVDAKGDPSAIANGFYGLYLKNQADELAHFQTSLAAEQTKLGPNAATRIDALDKALTAAIGKDAVHALLGDLTDPNKSRLYTAAAVEAAEAIAKKLSSQGGAAPGAAAVQQKKVEPTWEQKMWPKRFPTAKAG